MKHTTIAAAVAAALIASTPAWVATTADAQQQQTSYSDSEIKTYAEAVAEVQEINQKYQPKLQAAETQNQQQTVRNQAMDEMVEAIEEKGLSVEKYNEITQASQTDPAVAQKVKQYLQ